METDVMSLEILSPKGKMEIDASDISELRNRVAQELLQTEPGNVKLIAYGKVAPDEGSLSDFLLKPPILPSSQHEGRRRVYAICEQQQPSEAPTPAPESQSKVLDLMPDHIREDLQAGGTRFVDLTRSWERRFQEDPEATRLHLRSPQTRELLESMRVPGRMNPGAVPPISAIDIEALLMPSQKQKFLQGGAENSGPRGIQRDIQFYNQMLTDSLKPLMQRPTVTGGFGEGEPPRPSVQPTASADSPALSAGNLLERAGNNPEAVEAFKKAQESLRVLRNLAPDLLPELRQELGLVEKDESPRLGIETGGGSPLLGVGSFENTPPSLPRGLDLFHQGGGDLSTGLNGAAGLLGMLESLVSSARDAAEDGDGSGIGGSDGDGAATDEALANKYSVQLQHLTDMSFTDREANLRALRKTRGNLDAAIEKLLKKQKD